MCQRIEICGGIASGKTSFATLLSKIGCKVIYETFASNPFWEMFYSTPGKYDFETEITFTLQHYHQIKKQAEVDKFIACDYSFLLDIAYAEIGLKGSQLAAFRSVYEEINIELSPPALVVHLKCDPDTELARIRARGREVEKTITVDFLRALNEAVTDQVNKARGQLSILTIDSARNNFVDEEGVKSKLLQMVTGAMPQDK
jgi:deoxyadenosine/deoxycytidine kinase